MLIRIALRLESLRRCYYFVCVFKSLTHCLNARKAWIPEGTNAYRVIDGVGDGLEGVFADVLDDRFLVSTLGDKVPRILEEQLRQLGSPVYHKKLDKDIKQPPVQIFGRIANVRFKIREQNLHFIMDMSAGYSQGIFLDQRDNRRRVKERVSSGEKILNTFAYTGAFSVYAASGGAVTTTLDLAQPCLDWAKENFAANGINPESQYFCKGDTFHWLERFKKQGRLFNGIVLDPPTFSRNENGKIFRAESHYGDLVALAQECLEPGGWILCTTNCKSLSFDDFKKMVGSAAIGAELVAYGMPPDFCGDQYLKTIWLNY